MKPSDKHTLNYILKHKEHFDARLIEIANNCDAIVASLRSNIFILKSQNNQLKEELNDTLVILNTKNLKIKELQMLLDESDKNNNDLINKLKELEEELRKQKEEIKEKSKQVDELIKKNNELYEKMNRKIKKLESSNSTNSNMSSSFDVLSHTVSKANANTRIKSLRKRGGQKGHKIHKSSLLKEADYIINITVNKAPNGAIKQIDDNGKEYYITQEIDLSLNRKVIETHYHISKDGKHLDKDVLNKYAINCVTYSPHFKALMVYLNQRGTIPYLRLSQMINEMSNGEINIQPSTIVNWNKEIYHRSDINKELILHSLLKDKVLHVDETSIKINGKNNWIHTIANDKGSYFILTSNRKDLIDGPLNLLMNYDGLLVHDHFKSYQLLKKCKHVECNAHIDRYLKCGIDIDKNKECELMLNHLHKMLERKYELISQNIYEMDKDEILNFENEYLRIAKEGLSNYYKKYPNIEKRYEPEFVPTFKRMIIFKEDHLRFIKDFDAPYTNNVAERQCRAIKAKKKISGQFVSFDMAKSYVNILTLIQTAKINNQNTLAILESLFS